jgi:hypothetical protein
VLGVEDDEIVAGLRSLVRLRQPPVVCADAANLVAERAVNRLQFSLDDLLERSALVGAPLDLVVELQLLLDPAEEGVHAGERLDV